MSANTKISKNKTLRKTLDSDPCASTRELLQIEGIALWVTMDRRFAPRLIELVATPMIYRLSVSYVIIEGNFSAVGRGSLETIFP